MSVLLSPLSLQAADVRRSGDEAFIIQQQRQEALEQQLTPSAPDVRLSAPGSFARKINFPVETPCFQIKQTELKGADALPHWLPLQKIANGAVGHCLGAKGINLLMSTLQNRLVDHGYVTTRVLAPSQDLKSGILRLVIIPGVVRHVRLTPDSDDYIQLADIARSGRAGTSLSSRTGYPHRQRICRVTPLAFSLWLASGMVHSVSAAGIVADHGAPGHQQPTITQTASGIPQVNIQTPSAGGVSHNTYSQFDVGNQGVILNNAHNNVQTQLGGMVAGNPWLARGEARIILNEVNSRNPSQLNGFVEVAGKKAQVVIANPAGISCDGCGFINANRVTLTTGQPQMKNGSLTGFSVERGEIQITGKGMDASRTDYTDIIARSVKINAGLWAQDLKVTTGRNNVDIAHGQIEKKTGDVSSQPQMALDVASLGGMYAGKIRLVGTETGVGVRNAGHIGAQAGAVIRIFRRTP